ncbi:MAG: zinc-ribbon domain-containing protein [Candidatus Heimdallarchaeota archaeon]
MCRHVFRAFSSKRSATPANDAVLYCSNCGAQNTHDAKFCNKCAALLDIQD